MDELTWPELEARIARGAVVVILPTGGTEQNGPHMALGKHNYVVRRAAGRIATQPGHCVGSAADSDRSQDRSSSQPEIFIPGTLGLSDETFARVLRRSGRPCALRIQADLCLIGDHGQSQAVQAARLRLS